MRTLFFRNAQWEVTHDHLICVTNGHRVDVERLLVAGYVEGPPAEFYGNRHEGVRFQVYPLITETVDLPWVDLAAFMEALHSAMLEVVLPYKVMRDRFRPATFDRTISLATKRWFCRRHPVMPNYSRVTWMEDDAGRVTHGVENRDRCYRNAGLPVPD